MKATDSIRYQRKRKFFRTFFGLFSLSGILFAFQACYGTPQDFGMDVHVEGKIISAANQMPVSGLKVQVDESGAWDRTLSDGSFAIFCERMPSYHIIVTDDDGALNGTFQAQDTTVQLPEQTDKLVVNIVLK